MATINQITVNSTTYDLAVNAANVSGTVANATTATKLGTANKGSATQPIYLSAGAPAACTYSLAKSVPADAKFTDTTYSNFVKSGSGAAAGLVPAPSTTAGTTKYLREDGTWQVPPTSYTLPTASSSTLGGVKVGTGLGISSGTLSVAYGTTASTACAGNDSRLSDTRTPKAHASTATTYGIGTESNYGHIKLSDSYTTSGGAAAAGVAASSYALVTAYNTLNSNFNNFATKEVLTLVNRYTAEANAGAKSVPCLWSSYVLLIFAFNFYGNILETVIVPSSWFGTTHSGGRIQMNGTGIVEIYQNGNENIMVNMGQNASPYALTVYGILN